MTDLPRVATGTTKHVKEEGIQSEREGALRSAFRRVREGLTSREESLFLFLAVLLGAFAGLAVVCFRVSIEFTRVWLLGSGLHPTPMRTLLAPTLGGLVVAFLVTRYFPRIRGSGVTQTKSAVYIYDGYIPFGTVLQKFVLCALAIGSGHSLGPEDPSLQIGAGMASGRAWHRRSAAGCNSRGKSSGSSHQWARQPDWLRRSIHQSPQ